MLSDLGLMLFILELILNTRISSVDIRNSEIKSEVFACLCGVPLFAS
jgi:hypothetical protein